MPFNLWFFTSPLSPAFAFTHYRYQWSRRDTLRIGKQPRPILHDLEGYINPLFTKQVRKENQRRLSERNIHATSV